MANRVLRVERGGALLGSFALDADPVEVVLVDGEGVLCRWLLPAPPVRRPAPAPQPAVEAAPRRGAIEPRAGLRVDEPRPAGLDRGDGDDLTLPLPEPTETTGGAPPTEEAPVRPGPRPAPNLARPPLGTPPAGPRLFEPKELTLPAPEPTGARELSLPLPDGDEDEDELSLPMPAPASPPPARPLAPAPAAPRPGAGPTPAAPSAASARPRPAPLPAPPRSAPPRPAPPPAPPARPAPAPVVDPGASASRPAPRAAAADEEDSFTAAAGFAAARALADAAGRVDADAGPATTPGPGPLGVDDFDLGEDLSAPRVAPAEVWVRRQSEWRAGGKLAPGQRAVARGGWVRYGEDGVLTVDPGPGLSGSATFVDGQTIELAAGAAPRRLAPGASVMLRDGDYALYVRAEVPGGGA
jgi:hypothetical protein